MTIRRDQMLACALTYAGTLPMVGTAVLTLIGEAERTSLMPAVMAYSAIIIAFLAGIHWAVYLFFGQRCPRNLLLTSNIVALVAWISLLVQHSPFTIWLQVLCFLYMLTLDLRLANEGILPAWFYALRRNATIVVVLSLATFAGHV